VTIGGRIVLKAGRDGPVRGGNPWIFSQAIAHADPSTLAAGEWVEVRAAGGDVMGCGYYNPNTTIAVRMLAFGAVPNPGEVIAERLHSALALRKRIISEDTNCYRLINGEGDMLPGVVADLYGDVVVLQLLTAGAERMRDEIAGGLHENLTPRAIVERSHGAVRRQEGLADRSGLLAGELPPETIVSENGIRLAIDLEHGQKTGYFLDQRENRLIAKHLARDARVLDGYCYAGGFALAALTGNARQVVAVDTSERALSRARRNLELNGYGAAACELVHGETARYLAECDQRFDLVVLDPPALARSLKDAERAGHLYVELNAIAMKAVARGGSLMTFSCSVHFRGEDFMRAVRIAQTKARRNFRLVRHLGPGGDHPALLGHPEGEYLSGVLLSELE